VAIDGRVYEELDAGIERRVDEGLALTELAASALASAYRDLGT
jgi:hypothetical protein